MGIAKTYDCVAVEKEFDEMVSAGVEDIHIFNANMMNKPTPVNADILVNFDEFFTYVLDIKKTEKEISGLSAANAVVASVSQHEMAPPHQNQQKQTKPAPVVDPSPRKNQKKV